MRIVLILFFLLNTLHADINSTISNAFANGSAKGNITLFGYNIDRENEENAYATALGGYLKYTTDSKLPIFASARFYHSEPVGGDKNREQTYLFQDDGSSLTTLAESFVALKYKRRVLKAGNFMLKTPMMNDDVTRIVPWSYQGAAFTSEAIADTIIQINYITQIRSHTSDDYIKQSASGEFDKGITMLGLTYEGIDEINFQSYYYHAPELYSTWITQLDYKHVMEDEYLLCLGIQYFNSGEGGEYNDREAKNGGDDINLLALKTGLNGPFYDLTLNYSQNFGLSGIVKGYGGLAKVYTTSMVANGRGNYKPETWMLKSRLELDQWSSHEDEVAIWLTNTRVKDIRGDDFDAIYAHYRHHFNIDTSLYIRYESIHYKDKNDVSYLRIIAAYNF
ncbi:MAG: porin [Candidatus Neomarinimicrobiota bacterium]|nr:MAG: porin [Candidatus Neomarinimicrobiota bacterium]